MWWNNCRFSKTVIYLEFLPWCMHCLQYSRVLLYDLLKLWQGTENYKTILHESEFSEGLKIREISSINCKKKKKEIECIPKKYFAKSIL